MNTRFFLRDRGLVTRALGQMNHTDHAHEILFINQGGGTMFRDLVYSPSVRIGHDSVIAAGSVVTHDIPPNVIAGGNPARVIKEL